MVPSDMKRFASFSGELSNSSIYFSSFANVNRDNKRTANGTLGILPENTWQPRGYERRLKVIKDMIMYVSRLCDMLLKPKGFQQIKKFYSISIIRNVQCMLKSPKTSICSFDKITDSIQLENCLMKVPMEIV
jgi:hypothetical protein